MNKQNNNEWYIPSSSEYSNISNSPRNSGLSHFVERTQTLHTFYVIAGCCQVLLGVSVITVSVLGLLRPLWVSVGLVMGASVTTMIGLYLLYITASKSRTRKSLLRTAMQRVMEAKN